VAYANCSITANAYSGVKNCEDMVARRKRK